MFLSLFYALRAGGIDVSLNEWLLLLKGLEQGLHHSTIDGFYVLCRAILLHSEADFDKFDLIFESYFKEIYTAPEVSEEMLSWLNEPETEAEESTGERQSTGLSRDMIEKMFAKRLKDQKDQHNGGKKWIGTGGYTAYGNKGKRREGIRVGGESTEHSAYRVIGERRYRDWRWDNTIDARQFQAAFRRLRQMMAGVDGQRTELDLEATIHKTCSQGGMLQIEFARPRKNGIKVLMLIDSGGSMEPHQQLCSMLFQSVQRAGNFKDLKIFYFHNALQSQVYLEPTCDWRSGVELEGMIGSLTADYRVIFVGDAIMTPDELLAGKKGKTALDHFRQVKSRFKHCVWFHPQTRPTGSNYFNKTFYELEMLFEMHPLTVEGLSVGMKRLLANR